MNETNPPASPPCLLGEDDPEIDPAYSGINQETNMQVLAGNTIIYCQDWAAMVAFYRGMLGLQPTFEKDDWFIELQVCAGCHLSLAAAARCTIPSALGKGLTLSWRVNDLAGLHQRLLAQGLGATAITSHSWRAPYFYIHDPEGNRIELWNDSV